MPDILKLLEDKGPEAAEEISDIAIQNPDIIEELLNLLYHSDTYVSYGAIKALHSISVMRPSFLYDYFNVFYVLLESDDAYMKWNVIDILANFADIDKDNRINEEVLAKFFNLLQSESNEGASQSIDNLWKIAKYKPEFEEKITKSMLNLENIKRNEEAKNIHIGKALTSMSNYFIYSNNKADIINFAKKSLNNPQKDVKDQAYKLFNQWNKDNPDKEQK